MDLLHGRLHFHAEAGDRLLGVRLSGRLVRLVQAVDELVDGHPEPRRPVGLGTRVFRCHGLLHRIRATKILMFVVCSRTCSLSDLSRNFMKRFC